MSSGSGAPGDVTITPPPSDDGEVAAIVAALQVALRRAAVSLAPEPRSGWRFAGRWWR